jgi:valyl-tRNA synthetase
MGPAYAGKSLSRQGVATQRCPEHHWLAKAAAMTELAKTFDPAAIEAKWYAHWEGNGLFRPERSDRTPFTIVNPPPNVTGSLHIGHALDNTLQDVVVRYERLKGKDALWVVGTDHAGIATQMVVERELEKSQDKRTNYSREDFIAKVWEWKAESGGTITRQLRRLGCSMDWSREQFTMDPHFTRAVVKVFVDLYNEGLIYRDKRLVNWDPKLKTAISDLEVETQEIQGKFWTLKYPLASGDGHVFVATHRPETMLADMAVAVHPSDERYKALVDAGAKCGCRLRGAKYRSSPTSTPIRNSAAARSRSRRGMTSTTSKSAKEPASSPRKCSTCSTPKARVAQTADGLIPAELLGLDRFVARERVVAMLEAEGLLEKVEDRVIPTPFGDRGGVVIEPWLTDQWYVDAEKLAVGADRGGARRPDRDRPQGAGEDLLQLDGEHSAVVRQPPAVVGAPDSGVVWAGSHDEGTGLDHTGDRPAIFVANTEEMRTAGIKYYLAAGVDRGGNSLLPTALAAATMQPTSTANFGRSGCIAIPTSL